MSAQQLSAPQRSTPQRAAPNQGQGSAPGAALAQAPAKGAPGAAAPKQKGVMGWLRGAGAWVSEKASAASKAVGDFVDTSRQVAKDAYEVAKATDIGWKDGKLSVETDLDELMDLVPAHIRAALQLDRDGADNRCKVSLDPRSGVLVLTSAAVAIGAVDAPGLKTGPAFLRDVRVEIARPGGGLNGVDPAEAAKSDGGAAVKITVGSADVSAVKFQGAAGPVTLDRLALEGLSGELGRQGGPLSLAGGDGRASFALKSAVLAGLRAQGHEVAAIKVAGASGALGQGGEQAHLAAEQLEVSGAKSGGQTLGSARVKGMRVDAQNKGGGLPLADAKADHLRAKVAVEAAEVKDFDGADADVREANLIGAAATFDQDAGQAGLSARQLGLRGLDTAWIDAKDASLDELKVDHAQAKGGAAAALAVDAGSLRGSGVSVEAPAKAEGAAPSAPLDWSAKLGKADVADAQAGGVRMGGLRARALSAEGRAAGPDSRYAARAAQLGASGVEHKDVSAADVAAVDVAVRGSAAGAEASAAAISAQELKGAVLSASSLRGKGAAGRFGPDGAAGSVAEASVRDATVMGRVKVAEADVSGLQAGPAAGGGRSLSLDEASVSGVHDSETGARLGRARMRAGALTAHKGGLAGSLGQLQAEEISAAGATVAKAQLDDLAVQKTDAELRAKAGALRVDGANFKDQARADSLRAGGIEGSLRRDGADVSVATLQGAGLSGAGATVTRAEATGLRGAVSGDTVTGGLDHAAVHGVTAKQGTLGSASVDGLRARTGPGGAEGTLDAAQLTGLDAGGVKVGEATAAGLRGAQGADGLSGAAARLDARAVSAAGVSAQTLSLSEISGAQGKDSRSLRLGSGELTGLSGAAGGAQGSADRVALRGLQAGQSGGATTLGLAHGEATNLKGGAGGARGAAASVQLDGLQATHGGGVTEASLATGQVKGLSGAAAGTAGAAQQIDLAGARLREDAKRRSLGLDGLKVQGARAQLSGGGARGGAPSGLDTRQLAATAAQRVDHADLSVQAPLRTGAVPGVPVKVREGTSMDASVQVRDNRLVPGGTGVDLSRPLDGPAWTGVRGAYMNEDGELKADLSGTLGIDLDVGGKINDSLGIKGDALPSLGTLGAAYARAPQAPSTGGPSAADAVDLSRHHAKGSVGLSAGTISAGQAGGVELAKGQRPGDNVVKFESDGRTGQRAAMERILLNGARAKQGGVEAVAGKSSASGVDLRTGGGKTQAEIDALQVQGLQLEQRKS